MSVRPTYPFLHFGNPPLGTFAMGDRVSAHNAGVNNGQTGRIVDIRCESRSRGERWYKVRFDKGGERWLAYQQLSLCVMRRSDTEG